MRHFLVIALGAATMLTPAAASAAPLVQGVSTSLAEQIIPAADQNREDRRAARREARSAGNGGNRAARVERRAERRADRPATVD